MLKGQKSRTLGGMYEKFEHKWQLLQAMLPTQMTKYLKDILKNFCFPFSGAHFTTGCISHLCACT